MNPKVLIAGALGFGVLGLIALTLGAGLLFGSSSLIKSAVNSQVLLENGTFVFDNWQNPPLAIYIKFRFFEVGNPEEVATVPNTKLYLIERGPYTYRMRKPRVDIQFFPDNSSLNYRQVLHYDYFVPEMSKGDAGRDKLTVLNVPLVVVADLIDKALKEKNLSSDVLETLINGVYKLLGESLFITKTPAELLWGYDETLMRDVGKLLKRFFNRTIDNKFGFFTKRMGNNSDDGVYNVYTGRSDSSKLARINTWQSNSSLTWWATEYSNRFNGTDGTIQYSGVDENSRLYAFQSFLYRQYPMDFVGKFQKYGIPMLRYAIPPTALGDPKDFPDNRAYCLPSGTLKDCRFKAGVLDMSLLNNDEPVVLAWPHFYMGDPEYKKGVNGLRPDSDEFQTFVDVEPLTGSVLNISFKSQPTLVLKPYSTIKDTHLLPKEGVLVPLLWNDEGTEMDDALAEHIQTMAIRPVSLISKILPTLFCSGSVVLLLVSATFFTLFVYPIWAARQIKPDSDYHASLERSALGTSGSSTSPRKTGHNSSARSTSAAPPRVEIGGGQREKTGRGEAVDDQSPLIN